jgi:hypothetical protein
MRVLRGEEKNANSNQVAHFAEFFGKKNRGMGHSSPAKTNQDTHEKSNDLARDRSAKLTRKMRDESPE